MKKILSLILASVLSVGLHAQTSNYGHAASLGSNAADAGGDVVGPASSTNNAFARFSGTTGKLLQDTPDLTYSSPTMSAPDGFVLSSAGSIGLTAGGTAKSITLTPSTTGIVSVVGSGVRLDGTARSLSAWGTTGPSFSALARTTTDTSSSGTVATAVANSFAVPTFAASSATTFTNAANLYIAGDVAAGTNVTLTNSYGLWNVGKTRLDGLLALSSIEAAFVTDVNANVYRTGSAGGAYPFTNAGNLVLQPRSTGAIGDVVIAGGNPSAVVASFKGSGANLVFNTTGTDNGNGRVQISSTSSTNGYALGSRAAEVIYRTGNDALRTDSSWTVNGNLVANNGIITGGAGNMTITAGTGNSRTMALQTTTSGGVATNALVLGADQSATITGRLVETPSALTYASPTSVDVTLASVYTVTTVNATGSVTFNATAGGTAGQQMTILITNDATSAKTITFGTNFLSTGTLTASAASRHTSITFCSNGTSWFETGRAVMTN